MTRLGVSVLVAMALLWAAPAAHASTVSGLTVDNSSPTRAAGARTIYTIHFTTTAPIPTLGTINLGLPTGTGFSGYNNSSVVDAATGAAVGACGGGNTQTFTVTCSLFNGQSVAAGRALTVTLNGVANPPSSGTLVVTTTGDADAASATVAVVTASGLTGASADNTSPTTAARARTVFTVTFTTSATGALANAADSIITLAFPSGTGFDGYNNSKVVDGGVAVGSCGGANTATLTIVCTLFGSASIAAGDTVTVTLNGIANPPAGGNLTVSTSSDTSASPAFGVTPSQPLSGAAVDNTSPTIAAGGRTVYSIKFTTSSGGELANAADSIITLAFPSGTGFNGYNNSKVVDRGASVGSCGGANTRTLVITCSLFGGESIPAGDEVQVTLNGITNPPAGGAVIVSTTSDTAVAPSFTVAPAQPLTGLTTTVGDAAPGAATSYTIDFTTSPVGALANAADSVITLVFPAGTGFAGYNSSSVVDSTAGGGPVGSCGGVNLNTLTVTCPLFGGQAIPAGHTVRVTLGNLTNRAAGGPYAVAVSTTSDPGTAGPPPDQGGGQATPTPQPTVPPTPTPTPTATPVPAPTPVAGRSVVAAPVKGTVKVRLPGTNRFVDVDATQGVPLGSTVDTTHGTIRLTAVQKPGGKPQSALFYAGVFKVTQTRKTTDLTLNQSLAPCRKRATAAAAKKRRPKTRRLWGDGHGSFRTRGQYSAATVRGTKWLVQDSCAGTLTRVAHGVVSVRDNVRHRTITLRAGKHYLARPRR